MKKVIISLALLLTAAVSTNAQLLYKISGNGLTKTVTSLAHTISQHQVSPTAYQD
jgi:hypothetical protein